MDPDLFNERPLAERLLLVKEHADWLCSDICGEKHDHVHVYFLLHDLVVEVYLEFQGLHVQDVRALHYADEQVDRLLWLIWLGDEDLSEFQEDGGAPF